jgi:hypothetical protein
MGAPHLRPRTTHGWLSALALPMVLVGLLAATWFYEEVIEEQEGARAYILHGAGWAGVLHPRGGKPWVAAARDSVLTPGIVTCAVPSEALDEIAAAAEEELGPAIDGLSPDDRALILRLSERFGLPERFHPFAPGEPEQVFADDFLGRDLVLLSRERGRAWFFRGGSDG